MVSQDNNPYNSPYNIQGSAQPLAQPLVSGPFQKNVLVSNVQPVIRRMLVTRTIQPQPIFAQPFLQSVQQFAPQQFVQPQGLANPSEIRGVRAPPLQSPILNLIFLI